MAVLPIYNAITLPESNLYMKTDSYTKLTGKSPYLDEKVTLIISKKEIGRKGFHSDSFYPIGLTGTIEEVNENG